MVTMSILADIGSGAGRTGGLSANGDIGVNNQNQMEIKQEI